MEWFWAMKAQLTITVVTIVGLKIYFKLTAGKCRSKARLDGKTAIVTGANSGIGKMTALDLARRGARVILACRDQARGQQAVDEIKSLTGCDHSHVVLRQLDLASFNSVREFADLINRTEPRLDILINNAGLSAIRPRVLTEDGYEMIFAVNHLGPFLLTNLLLDLIKVSAPSRIVNVSSVMHKWGKIEFDNLNSEKWFVSRACYSRSKLANILFTRHLARMLQGTGVVTNSLSPGFVDTDIFRNWTWFFKRILRVFMWIAAKTPEDGAQTTIHLAVAGETAHVSGKYFADCRITKEAVQATDDAVAAKLWEYSERAVGL